VNALTSYTQQIEEALSASLFPERPAELYDPLRYFLQLGGKRIRPVLTLMGAEIFGGTTQEVMPQALAIELFHNFTLIHDDIMDAAPTRRKQVTVHEKWDSNIAILSGDVLFIKAFEHLAKIDSAKLPDALQLFNTTAVLVCEGQQLDMNFESRMDVSTSEYIEMIRLKTSVLLGCALEMGALVAEASAENRALIYSFGESLGIAFQIQDDILDLYADPSKFGKMVGGDVAANKKTLLHLTAVSHATSSQIQMLQQLQNETDLDLKISRTRELFDHLEIREKCREVMVDYQAKALLALESIDVPYARKEGLRTLSDYLLNRDV